VRVGVGVGVCVHVRVCNLSCSCVSACDWFASSGIDQSHMCRVGQAPMYTVYLRHFWQEFTKYTVIYTDGAIFLAGNSPNMQSYIRYIHGVFGRELTKYAVSYGVLIRLWLTLCICACHPGATHNFLPLIFIVFKKRLGFATTMCLQPVNNFLPLIFIVFKKCLGYARTICVQPANLFLPLIFIVFKKHLGFARTICVQPANNLIPLIFIVF